MDEACRILGDGRVFFDYGPASMVVTARCGDEDLSALAASAFPLIRDSLAEIAAALPVLRQYPVGMDYSSLTGLPRIMAEAVTAVGEPTLTPMAAVAGTMADAVADWLFARGADLVAVNNGGDVAVRLGAGRTLRMGILPDFNGSVTEIVEIRAEDGIGGVCTSGLGGRSLTRGIAGGVTVFSGRCAIADACATHIANCSYIESPRVHTCITGEIEPESDIADLRIVTAVEPLLSEEKKQGLAQVQSEAERQAKLGNLMRVYADIQGERIFFVQ
jgi:uncharacterized protein